MVFIASLTMMVMFKSTLSSLDAGFLFPGNALRKMSTPFRSAQPTSFSDDFSSRPTNSIFTSSKSRNIFE